MITGMFCYRLRPDIDMAEYEAQTVRMYERVTANPDFGFRDLRSYTGADGESVLIAEFDSAEGLTAWRNDPEHVKIQERARTEWFDSYWVAELTRRTTFDHEHGRQEIAADPVS